jgi:hypothetical protein
LQAIVFVSQKEGVRGFSAILVPTAFLIAVRALFSRRA